MSIMIDRFYTEWVIILMDGKSLEMNLNGFS